MSTALATIRKRADFVAANRGLRVARPGFVLLARPNGGLGKRFGVTVTKKIGNAVVRNRMKRRFRELLRAALSEQGLPDHDHVLIGREGGIERDFAQMREELSAALMRAAEGKGDPPRRRKGLPRHGEGDRAKRGGGGSPQTPRSAESPLHRTASGPPPHPGEDY